MAKNKGTHGKAKSSVELEDEFVAGAGKVATALAPHTKRLVILAALVLVAASVWAGWDWYQKKRARELTHQASDALLVAVAPIAAETQEPPLADSYPSAEARRAAALNKLQEVGEQGNAGLAVRLVEARKLLDAGKYEEAISAYRAFAGAQVPELMRVMAREGVGYAEEARAMANEDPKARTPQLEAALAAFQQMQPDPKGPLYNRALYHQGRLLAALDRRDQAVAKYREILGGDPGELEGAVSNRLAALEKQSK